MKRYILVMLFAASSAVYGSDWAHNAINLTHKFGDGSGVKVGIMDGEARCSHQELSGHCTEYYSKEDTGQYYSNHGTHVATIIAGKDKAPDWVGHDGGVAPNANIYIMLCSVVHGALVMHGGFLMQQKQRWLILQQVMAFL